MNENSRVSTARNKAAPRTSKVRGAARSKPARTEMTRSGSAAVKPATGMSPAPNLAQTVYEQIKADIFEFRLIPGARFSENGIALRLGVSRTPVREALYRLAREGFLAVHAKSGWSVHALDFDRFDQLYDVRIILELAAVRMLCDGEHKEDLASLKRAWLIAPRARLNDARSVAELDEGFHMTLIAATGNNELVRIYTDLTERIRIVRRLDFTQSARITRTYEEHAAVLRAIVMRKTQQAMMLLRAHIEESKLEVRKISLHRLHLAQRHAAR